MIRRLVIHVAEGGFAGTYNWFGNSAAQASAHYVVSPTGRVAQMVPGTADIAWHAGNWHITRPRSASSTPATPTAAASPTPSTADRRGCRMAGTQLCDHARSPACDRPQRMPDPYHPGHLGRSRPPHRSRGPTGVGALMGYCGCSGATPGGRSIWSTAVCGRNRLEADRRKGSLGGGARVHPCTQALGRPLPGVAARHRRIRRVPALAVRVRRRRRDTGAALDHGRPAHGDRQSARGMRHVAVSRQLAVRRRRLLAGRDLGAAGSGLVLADAVRMVKWSDIGPPSVVSSLTAGPITSSSIEFDWGGATDNMRVWGYQAVVDGHIVQLGSGHSYVASGLPCGSAAYGHGAGRRHGGEPLLEADADAQHRSLPAGARQPPRHGDRPRQHHAGLGRRRRRNSLSDLRARRDNTPDGGNDADDGRPHLRHELLLLGDRAGRGGVVVERAGDACGTNGCLLRRRCLKAE